MKWKLDGEEREPETLSGVSGELELEMSVKSNENIDDDFFNQYALQISIPIDPERTQMWRRVKDLWSHMQVRNSR